LSTFIPCPHRAFWSPNKGKYTAQSTFNLQKPDAITIVIMPTISNPLLGVIGYKDTVQLYTIQPLPLMLVYSESRGAVDFKSHKFLGSSQKPSKKIHKLLFLRNHQKVKNVTHIFSQEQIFSNFFLSKLPKLFGFKKLMDGYL